MQTPVYGVHLRNQTPLTLIVTPTGTAFGRVVSVQLVGETTGGGPVAKHPIVSRAMTAGSTYTTISPYIVSAFQPTTSFEGRYSYTTAPSIVTSPLSNYNIARDGVTVKASFPKQSGLVFGQYGVAVYGSCSNFRWTANVHFEVL